jgi:hypothetical protein
VVEVASEGGDKLGMGGRASGLASRSMLELALLASAS